MSEERRDNDSDPREGKRRNAAELPKEGDDCCDHGHCLGDADGCARSEHHRERALAGREIGRVVGNAGEDDRG